MDGWMTRVKLIMMGTPTDLGHSLAQHPDHEWMDGCMDDWGKINHPKL
jgi:hypothetical protein